MDFELFNRNLWWCRFCALGGMFSFCRCSQVIAMRGDSEFNETRYDLLDDGCVRDLDLVFAEKVRSHPPEPAQTWPPEPPTEPPEPCPEPPTLVLSLTKQSSDKWSLEIMMDVGTDSVVIHSVKPGSITLHNSHNPNSVVMPLARIVELNGHSTACMMFRQFSSEELLMTLVRPPSVAVGGVV